MMTNFIIVFFAEYLHYFVVLIAGSVFFVYRLQFQKKQMLFTTVFSIALAVAVDKLLNQIIDSPRPFVADGIIPLFSHVADNGFPSEHTLLATVLAGLVYIYNKKIGIFLIILSVTIGIARVVAGVHHIIDILGALIIAVLAVLVGKWLVTRYSGASS